MKRTATLALALALLTPATPALAQDRDRTPHPSRSAPSADVRFLRCVIAHESGGNPRAQNPYSSASGLFQFIDSTWRHYNSKIKGAKQYAKARHAPAIVQWQAALLAVKWGGHGHWKGTGCGYGT